MNPKLVVALVLAVSACKKEEEPPPPPTDTAATTTPVDAPTITPLGSPMYTISEVALFTGPSGDGTAVCLLNGPHFFDMIVWAPGDPHPPPYSSEFSSKLGDCGLTAKTVFDAADMEGAQGIWLGVILEAAAGNAPGSSPDFPLGDVIYFDRFPFVVDADVRRDDILVDTDHDFLYPDASTWGFVVTGLSHVPLLFRTNLERMPAGATSPGEYEWHLKVRDATDIVSDSGYDLVVPYRVLAPE